MEGATRLEGRVEMCKNSMWGTVCNSYSYWDKQDARVVCRQLGLSVTGELLAFMSAVHTHFG